MPKRDEAYMEGQRELIARAALECMLEKGVYETSTRDVCAQAGISMGALYIHYKTRDDLMIAACTLEPILRESSAATKWADYVAATRSEVARIAADERRRRRLRLSLQFVAEHVLHKENPPGANELYSAAYAYCRDSLEAIHERGEITLPLGLEATAALHFRMYVGSGYAIAADKRIDARETAETLIAGLALTAGLKEAPQKRLRARKR